MLPSICRVKDEISSLREFVKPIWITLIRGSDPDSYIEQFSCLQKQLGFDPEFISFLYGECAPIDYKVSENLAASACNFFNLHKNEVSYEYATDWVVGNSCMEGFYIFINAFRFEFNHAGERKQN